MDINQDSPFPEFFKEGFSCHLSGHIAHLLLRKVCDICVWKVVHHEDSDACGGGSPVGTAEKWQPA